MRKKISIFFKLLIPLMLVMLMNISIPSLSGCKIISEENIFSNHIFFYHSLPLPAR
jgi:hypothetical protein